MKGAVIALGTYAGRPAAGYIVDGRIEDLLVDPPDPVPRFGTVFRARIARSAGSMGGHFLDLPEGTAFCRDPVGELGETALVQVSGFAEPGKAVPVTTKISLRGRFVVVTPGRPGLNVSRSVPSPRRAELKRLITGILPSGAGAIVRSAAADADDAAIRLEAQTRQGQASMLHAAKDGPPAEMLRGATALDAALWDWSASHTATFDDFDVLDQIDAIRAPFVPLGAGHAMIEPTQACVAIDVNAGGDFSPAAGLKANLALVKDLPRQLRCRGLGGAIVIDMAPCRKKDRPRIDRALAEAFAGDPIATDVLGWTALGHVELRRRRSRYPLAVA